MLALNPEMFVAGCKNERKLFFFCIIKKREEKSRKENERKYFTN